MIEASPRRIEKHSVLITGASTGIGYATALLLDRSGFSVFAGIRRRANADKLRSANITPVYLDVTDDKSIRQTTAVISEATGAELYALVNNAGISIASVVELMPLDDFRKLLEVNLIGLVAVTQAFLPMLRRSRGRIVNIGALNSKVSMFGIGGYSASKFGLDAMSDALRLELKSAGIHVSMVNPGQVKTPIFDKARDYFANQEKAPLAPELQDSYEQIHQTILWGMRSGAKSSLSPDKVAQVIRKALTARNPRARYSVGSDAKLLILLKRVLPDRTMDWLLTQAANVLSRRPGTAR